MVWHCKGHGKPFIVAGDFNVAATDMMSWWRQMGWEGIFCRPEAPTCRGPNRHSTLDFFIVHPILSQAVGDTTVLEEASLATHLPVVLQLNRAGVEEEVEVFQRWPELPTKAVTGPRGCFAGIWKIWEQQKEALQKMGKKGWRCCLQTG